MNPIKTKEACQNFLSQNIDAWQFAVKASDDYLLARCGLLNNLWSSFEMATQATEKLLKSYLLFKDSSLRGSGESVRLAVAKESRTLGRKNEAGHNIKACLSLSRNVGLPITTALENRLARIDDYYSLRYPNDNSTSSLSTSELNDFDAAIFEIWDAFESIDEDYFYIHGIMSHVYSKILRDRKSGSSSILENPFQIMTSHNKSYNDRKAKFEEGIYRRLEEWYPISSD
jgi:hypothetical protein